MASISSGVEVATPNRRPPCEASIIEGYVERHGSAALAVPPNEGGLRAIYLVPIGAGLAGAFVVVTALRRWKRRGELAPANGAPISDGPDDYDQKLDEELDRL